MNSTMSATNPKDASGFDCWHFCSSELLMGFLRSQILLPLLDVYLPGASM